MSNPSLEQIITYLDEGNEPLLQRYKEYIEKALNGENVYIPPRSELRLSRFLVELGVIVTYLTGQEVIMWTHCEYWAMQARKMQQSIVICLNHQFGNRQTHMDIRVPFFGQETFDHENALVLAHGLKPTIVDNHQFIYQDLGPNWDGMIRPTLAFM